MVLLPPNALLRLGLAGVCCPISCSGRTLTKLAAECPPLLAVCSLILSRMNAPTPGMAGIQQCHLAAGWLVQVCACVKVTEGRRHFGVCPCTVLPPELGRPGPWA